MPNSTTSSSRPSSKFLDRMLLGARGGIPQPEWVFHYFPDWKLSELASEWGIRAQPVTVICFNLHINDGRCRNCLAGWKCGYRYVDDTWHVADTVDIR